MTVRCYVATMAINDFQGVQWFMMKLTEGEDLPALTTSE